MASAPTEHAPLDRPVPQERGPAPRRRRPPAPLVGLVAGVLAAAGLLWRNRDVLRTPLYEVGDAAANSLLIADARSFDLLVGHYSRLGFSHPGPGVLYLEAFGEALFTDLLGLTPAPHNGQILAVVLLHAAALGAVAAVAHRWSGRWAVAAAALAAALWWYVSRAVPLADPWVPLVVVTPFLVLLVAGASVAAGRSRHLWLVAAAGGLLVHAHVAFALFVPVLAVAAVLAWAVTDRLGPRALLGRAPRHWAVAGAVVGVFVAPIVLNTLLNWPGEIPKYLSYSGGSTGPATPPGAAVDFTLQFWSGAAAPLPRLLAVALVVTAAAAAVTAPRPLRRPLTALTGLAAVAEGLFVFYALVGIDDLSQSYVGYFGWSIPAALLVVVTVALAAHLAALPPAAPAVGTVAAVLALVAAASPALAARSGFFAGAPEVLDAVEAAAPGRPLLIELTPGIQPSLDGPALLLQAEREGVPACIANPDLALSMTPQRICTAEERRTGTLVQLWPAGTVPDPTVQAFGDVLVRP